MEDIVSSDDYQHKDEGRRRSSKACDACSKRRSKCSSISPEDAPCERCKVKGIDCTFSRTTKKRGPPKGKSRQELQRRKTEEDALQGLLDVRHRHVSAVSPSSSVGTEHVPLTMVANHMQNPVADPPYQDNTNLHTLFDVIHARSNVSFGVSADMLATLPPLPSDEELRLLIADYFQFIYPSQPFLHKPTFWVRYQQVPLVLKVAMASAAADLSESVKVDSSSLFLRARAMVWGLLDEPPTLVTVQSMLALIVAGIRHSLPPLAFSMLGIVWHMIRVLKLAVDPDLLIAHHLGMMEHIEEEEEPAPISFIDKETRRRVFWTVFSMDRFSGAGNSTSTLFKPEDVFVNLPVHDSIWESSTPELLLGNKAKGPYAHTIELYKVFGDLVDVRFRCRWTNESHLANPAIVAKLAEWRKSLPPWVDALDLTGSPDSVPPAEDARWGYSALIIYHALVTQVLGPGEFKDFVFERVFGSIAGLAWIGSTLFGDCMESVKRVGRMMHVIRKRTHNSKHLDFGNAFANLALFQLGICGLVGVRAIALGLKAGPFVSMDEICDCVDAIAWAINLGARVWPHTDKLGVHLGQLLQDIRSFGVGENPTVEILPLLRQRKSELIREMVGSKSKYMKTMPGAEKWMAILKARFLDSQPFPYELEKKETKESATPASAVSTEDTYLVPNAPVLDMTNMDPSQIPAELQELLESMPLSQLMQVLGEAYAQQSTTKDFETLLDNEESAWINQ